MPYCYINHHANAPSNLSLLLMALWIAVLGGALIGWFHSWAQRQ